MPVQPHDIVLGLELLRVVGRGGEGEVWEAVSAQGARRALKLLRPDALSTPETTAARARFLERIDHPALVTVHRSGVLAGEGLDGWGFVEMEFVDGESLEQRTGGWDLLDRLVPLADALDRLHLGEWSDGLPLIHRDVKPANIVEGPDGRFVLVDPSTLRGKDSTVVTRIGTPVFAAPEVVTGRVGPAADVYSFAATALALLTGARREALAELIADRQRLDIPEGVRAGLADDPRERPVSCAAVLLDDAPTLVRDVPAAAVVGGTWALDPDDRPGGALTPAWGWYAALLVLLAVPALGWASGAVEGEQLVPVVAGAAVGHVLAHLLGRRSLGLAVLAPPVGWAFLLADRTVELPAFARVHRHRRRRDWLRAVLTGGLAVAAAGPLLAVPWPAGPLTGAVDATVVAALAVVGLATSGLALWAATAEGGGALAGRILLLPAWALGAVLLVAGAAVLMVPAVVVGRGGGPPRLAAATLAATGEVVREPPPPRLPAPPPFG